MIEIRWYLGIAVCRIVLAISVLSAYSQSRHQSHPSFRFQLYPPLNDVVNYQQRVLELQNVRKPVKVGIVSAGNVGTSDRKRISAAWRTWE